ncbi:MAG: superinfection immunity protein [Terricaulis sp.]
MGAGRWGFVAGVLGALLLASPSGVALAQVREESAEEFNARAQAQEEAYMRRWEAEQAALGAQNEPPPQEPAESNADRLNGYLREYGIEPPPAPEAEQLAAGSDNLGEEAGLRCLNENRAAVELPPLSLQEFREGRAAGTITTPHDLCGRDDIDNTIQQADANPVAESDTQPDFAAAEEHFARAAAWGRLQDQINIVGFLILAALIYFIPAIIAFHRRHHYRWPIFAFNLGAAWTGLGWIGTLVWALWPAQSAIIDPIVGDATGRHQR